MWSLCTVFIGLNCCICHECLKRVPTCVCETLDWSQWCHHPWVLLAERSNCNCYRLIHFPVEQAVLKEVTESEGQIVMFIDEIHTVVGAGATSGSMDASNLLKPMLARGELRCIGATTLNEYKQV